MFLYECKSRSEERPSLDKIQWGLSHKKTLGFKGKTLFPWPSNACSPYDTVVVLTVTAFEAHVEDCILSLHHLLL